MTVTLQTSLDGQTWNDVTTLERSDAEQFIEQTAPRLQLQYRIKEDS